MESLYILEPGSYLRKDGDCLKIMKERTVLDTIPAAGLERLTLVGRSSFSGAVIDFLIRQRIDTVFLSSTGRFRARLLLDEAGHVERRRHQYVSLADKKFVVEAARVIVRAKIENQFHHLRQKGGRYGTEALSRTAIQLRAVISHLQRADELDVIRGYEGYASRLYFGVFGLLLRNEEFEFQGRNRRPPRDPVNALLSFVYTMFTNEVTSAVNSCGLDPYLGALHEPAPGRPSLSCDLVEEWRVLAERMVLTLINRKVIRLDDFIRREKDDAGRPVEMKPGIARALISSYERRMQSRVTDPATGEKIQLRWLLHRQAKRYGKWLADRQCPYQPYRHL